MASKNRQNNQEEDDFYSNINTVKFRPIKDYQQHRDEMAENHQGKNCLSLALVWLILYSGLVFGIWKLAPFVRTTQDDIDQAKKEFQEKSLDSSSFFENLKERFNQSLTKFKKNIQDQASNKIKEEKEKVLDNARDQFTNSIKDLQ